MSVPSQRYHYYYYYNYNHLIGIGIYRLNSIVIIMELMDCHRKQCNGNNIPQMNSYCHRCHTIKEDLPNEFNSPCYHQSIGDDGQ